jgi:hypothetical protein
MVHLNTTMIVVEVFPDKLAIATEWSESQGQVFLYIRREN